MLERIHTLPSMIPTGTPLRGRAVAILAMLAALLVVGDPYIDELIPYGWWQAVYLGSVKFRVTLVVLLVLTALVILVPICALARTWQRFALIAVLIGAQTNGFRIGILDMLDGVTFLFLGIWLAHMLHLPNDADEATDVVFPMVLVIAAMMLALDIPNLMHQKPVRFVIGFLGLLKVQLMALLIIQLLRNWEIMRVTMNALIAVAALSAIAGLVQFALSYFLGINFTLIDDPESAFKPTPLGMIMRASGLCVTAQHLSGFLMLALPFMLWRLTTVPDNLMRLVYFGTTGLVLAGVLVTWNYGAMFITAMVVGLFPFLRWPTKIIHITLFYGVTALAAYYSGLLDLVYDLSFGDAGVFKGVSQRHQLMEFGFEKLSRDWWFGVGLRDMAEFTGNYWKRPVHNAYMQAITEIGLLGGLLFIAILIILTTRLFLLSFRADSTTTPYIRPMLLAVLGLAALMFSEPMLDHSNTWLLFGLAQAMILLSAQGPRPERGLQ